QAEDGIRDFHVTGVQTCALPISRVAETTALRRGAGAAGRSEGGGAAAAGAAGTGAAGARAAEGTGVPVTGCRTGGPWGAAPGAGEEGAGAAAAGAAAGAGAPLGTGSPASFRRATDSASPEIGRASCRERAKARVGGWSWTRQS